MNKATHCSFHINLTTEEKIRCWTIDEEGRKKQIELTEGEEEYDCSIQFDLIEMKSFVVQHQKMRKKEQSNFSIT